MKPADPTAGQTLEIAELTELLNEAARLYLAAVDARRFAGRELAAARRERRQAATDLAEMTAQRDSWHRLALLAARRAQRLSARDQPKPQRCP